MTCMKSPAHHFNPSFCCPDAVLFAMQFGKVDTSTYIMDYNPTEINAVQAFAISLSTFDTKLLL